MGISPEISDSSNYEKPIAFTNMEITKLAIHGAWQTYSPIIEDSRGCLKEWFNYSQNFKQTGLKFEVSQSIFSKSKKGVIRGIHYSLSPSSQWKWITCVYGSILDVIVDVRLDSPTFGQQVQVFLNDSNGIGVLIQGNLGHAFQSLTDNSILVYNLSSEYDTQFEKSINPLDKKLGIKWPIIDPIISKKDFTSPSLVDQIKMKNLPGIEN
jgi:dTDP-4-dehydrorhamnose 3,5-epimerase